MMDVRPTGHRKGMFVFAIAPLAALAFLALGLAAPEAGAQQLAQKADKQAAQAQPKRLPTEDIEWFKLCQDVPKREAPKEKRQECATSYEAYNPVTGQLLLMVQAKTVPGQADEDRFIVTVPIGLFIPAGAQARIDEDDPVRLTFVYCLAQGCIATMLKNEDHKPFLDKLQKGGKLTVLASTLQGQAYVSGIPLDGFTKAIKGKPMDVKAYQAKAKKVSEAIMARRADLQKKMADAKKNKEAAGQKKPQ
jgi:invasion protein IalB